ncbi:hypothetical protein L2D08_20315 [Domibacillus sp. PGB-M46]|uniref:hypothetical protein n=1 Tax=Domibacillus sp. PGB-M46 TaxID=2910255 RepID=UPI001F569D6F|nr:hypothetical protein [Domibacillus sp. PGB-M46]MCI2256680.1 hypothetical protein [Domibacillus sp. PGB-M46]
MENYKHLVVFIGVILLFVAGCSNEIKLSETKSNTTKNSGKVITVEKHSIKEGNYEPFREISDDDAVQKIEDILASIAWENAEVSMASPPHSRFHLGEKNEQAETNKIVYYLWVSPSKEKVELVIEGEGKYAQLSKGQSAELFQTITDRKLSDVK